jgi:hypothetical protein
MTAAHHASDRNNVVCDCPLCRIADLFEFYDDLAQRNAHPVKAQWGGYRIKRVREK